MRPWSQLSVNLSTVLSGESRSLGWGWHMLSPALFFYTFMGDVCHPCCGYQEPKETHITAVNQSFPETQKQLVNHRNIETYSIEVNHCR
jgi:hypothetical protein